MSFEFGKIGDCELMRVQAAKLLTQDMQQTITFSAVPTVGTWRIGYDHETTTWLDYNADAAAVKAALLLLSGINDIDVGGDYSDGFEITFQGVDGNTDKMKFEVATSGLKILLVDVTVTVEITGRGYDNLGNYRQGVLTETEISANVQPLTGKEIEQLPEYDKERRHLNLWTKTEITTNDSIEYEDTEFEVNKVELWRGYYRALIIERQNQ